MEEFVRLITLFSANLAFFASGIVFAKENPDEEHLRRVINRIIPLLIAGAIVSLVGTVVLFG